MKYINLIICLFLLQNIQSQIVDSQKTQLYLNIDSKENYFFFAYSIPNKYPKCDGCGISRNFPKKISDYKLTNNIYDLNIWIDTNSITTFGGEFYGYYVYLVNKSTKLYKFKVDDSKLNMRVQALDFNNEWKYIDTTYHSRCGLSYHEIFLDPGYFWKFKMPIFSGNYRTYLRIELSDICINNEIQDNVYSNIIEGNINVSQFYYPQNEFFSKKFFDPYIQSFNEYKSD